MKDSLGEEMPGVTRENIDELCYVLNQSCNPMGPQIGGVTFIKEEDPEKPPTVKLLILSPRGGLSIPLSEEQVHNILGSIENLTDYQIRQVHAALDKFCGTEGIAEPPDLVPPRNMERWKL